MDADYLKEHSNGWKCPPCATMIRSSPRSDSTPVGNTSSDTEDQPITLGVLKKLLEDNSNKTLISQQAILDKISSIADDISSIKSKQIELSSQIKTCQESLSCHTKLLADQDSALSECRENIDQISANYAKVSTDLSDINVRVSELEVAASSSSLSFPSSSSDTTNINESVERSKRSFNIIIRGLCVEADSTGSDVQRVAGVVNAIRPNSSNSLCDVVRMGGDANPSRTLKVIFNNPNLPIQLLRNKNKLLAHELYRNISISDDKTPFQLQELQKLREEMKAREASGEKNLTIKYVKGNPSIVTVASKLNPKN